METIQLRLKPRDIPMLAAVVVACEKRAKGLVGDIPPEVAQATPESLEAYNWIKTFINSMVGLKMYCASDAEGLKVPVSLAEAIPDAPDFIRADWLSELEQMKSNKELIQKDEALLHLRAAAAYAAFCSRVTDSLGVE